MNFNEETTFILGAGASKPYGYPVGAELISNIVENINSDNIMCKDNLPITWQLFTNLVFAFVQCND